MASNVSIPIAAVDAGSNAIRLSVARLYPDRHLREIQKERYAVRLGHNAFTEEELDVQMMHKALVAFRDIKRVFEHYKVEKYRAVATSAARDAGNSATLIGLVKYETGIKLEVIEGDEEARLVRRAVLGELNGGPRPGLILDLGGGSLEFNLMRNTSAETSCTLPLGTVRLMENLRIKGEISRRAEHMLRKHVMGILGKKFRSKPKLSSTLAVACGGNAETLAQIAPANEIKRFGGIDMKLLAKRLPRMLSMNVGKRMRLYGVRQDRAEVMAIAAVVFVTIAEWLDVPTILVPGVGVREGVLRDLAAYARFGTEKKGRKSEGERRKAKR